MSQPSCWNCGKQGIGEEAVRYVVLSHFHADHTAGLRDFPNASILYKRGEYTAIKDLGLLALVKAGCLPGLLLDDFEERSPLIDETPHPGGYPL